MGNDRVSSVDDLGVISSLVEHTHINAEVVGEIYGTAHCAFVRADDH